ncbi:uncharacterized protein LOC106133478 isoform X2 [Amyelois transitella]|nr:uncharacterized protein LOC106133478 isoform X2 [Amyelois transitella]
MIVLGHDQRSWIKRPHKDFVVKDTPNLLTQEEFRSFWILWNTEMISVGRIGESEPFIIYKNLEIQINYVTFSGKDGVRHVNWRIELPPEFPKLKQKSIIGGEPTWVAAGGQLPPGAIIGGYENGALYIIRATHRNALTPGKFVPSEGVAYVSWGSDAHEKEDFEVLVGYNFTWVPTSRGQIPVGAVVGGHTESHEREKLYVGCVRHGDHIIPGKVQPSHRVCYVAYKGKEIAHPNYEILVSTQKNNRCSNSIYYRSEFSTIEVGIPRLDSDEE